MTRLEAHPRHAPLDWVLVADAFSARCYARETDDLALRELTEFVPAKPCRRNEALADDRVGLPAKHDAAGSSQPHARSLEGEYALFARELARFLEKAALAQRYHQVALIGSNPFLGELRTQLGKATEMRLMASVTLDLKHCCGSELEHRVTQALHGLG